MRLKESDVVCWYPSSMLDFKSILNWEQARGNILQPNVFLFTDNLYINLINNYEDAIIQFQNDIKNIDFRFENYDIISFNEEENTEPEFSIENEQDLYYHMTPKKYLEMMVCVSFYGEQLKKLLQLNGQKIWIDGNLNLSGAENIESLGPIAGVSGWVNINNTNLTREDLTGIKVGNIYTYEDVNIAPINCSGMGCIEFADKRIIFIPLSNSEFYNYLIKNNIVIDCFFGKRTCDNFKYINTLTSIGIKEAMVGTQTGEEEYLMKNDFRYEKVGQPFLASDSHTNGEDEVQLYKVKTWQK